MRLFLLSLLPILLAAGCSTGVGPPSARRDASPRSAYLEALEISGLGGSLLARRWVERADSALASPSRIPSPYAEEGLLDPGDPRAMAWRLELRRGQRLAVRATSSPPAGPAGPDDPDGPAFFVEFHAQLEGGRTTRIEAPFPGDGESWIETRRDGPVIVLVQPELLAQGRYEVRISVEGSLAFPVLGRGPSAILSFFGAEREGGRRSHEGVDVFAPRGTPVVAVAEGIVSRVDTTPIGGRIVWVRDHRRRQSHYYAHLDQPHVVPGMRVRMGDPIGTVGNTGNARTTPPHLHFGVYQRGEGAIDPWPLLLRTGEAPILPGRDEDRLTGWVRVAEAGIRIREAPTLRARVLDEPAPSVPLRIEAGAGEWLRIRLPDGRGGFVPERLTRRWTAPLRVASTPLPEPTGFPPQDSDRSPSPGDPGR